MLDNALLPGVPARGPLALQHHGQKSDGVCTGPRGCQSIVPRFPAAVMNNRSSAGV